MLVKVAMIGLVAIALLVTWGTPSDAHGPLYAGGVLIHRSADCSVNYRSVPNPLAIPQQSRCELTVTSMDVLCQNNGGNIAPGHVPRAVAVGGQTPITENLVNKKKGTATVITTVIPACLTDPPAATDPCLAGVTNVEACPSAQWDLIAVLVREATMKQTGFRCSDDTCTGPLIPTSSGKSSVCFLPRVDFFTVVPPAGIPYDCTPISSQHINH